MQMFNVVWNITNHDYGEDEWETGFWLPFIKHVWE